jgi:hypothetical protein
MITFTFSTQGVVNKCFLMTFEATNLILSFVFQGLQVLLPDYLQERFVQAALSYIACNSEGEFICKDNDCWCHCGPKFPECNCPSMDIQAMEENLLRITETWKAYNSDFEDSGKTELLISSSVSCPKNTKKGLIAPVETMFHFMVGKFFVFINPLCGY